MYTVDRFLSFLPANIYRWCGWNLQMLLFLLLPGPRLNENIVFRRSEKLALELFLSPFCNLQLLNSQVCSDETKKKIYTVMQVAISSYDSVIDQLNMQIKHVARRDCRLAGTICTWELDLSIFPCLVARDSISSKIFVGPSSVQLW